MPSQVDIHLVLTALPADEDEVDVVESIHDEALKHSRSVQVA